MGLGSGLGVGSEVGPHVYPYISKQCLSLIITFCTESSE